jgi:hypothetical protein
MEPRLDNPPTVLLSFNLSLPPSKPSPPGCDPRRVGGKTFFGRRRSVPFFFDLSSILPTIERNPFAPVVVADEVPAEPSAEEIPAEPIVDTGLPIPPGYDIDLMRALVQDPFHLFVYWQLKDNPYDRLRRIFPPPEVETFHTALKLIDETTRIAVYFDAAFAREYWFEVFPDRHYRVELGLRSPRHGYIKLLSSQPAHTPRVTVSDQAAPEPEYHITAEDYLRVLRESHILPERAFTPEGLLPMLDTAQARAAFWEALPRSFRHLLEIIVDIQAGRDYDKLWERLDQAELTGLVRQFIEIIRQMGGGELGYILLLRHLPEVLRRVLTAEGELAVDAPLDLHLAERLGLSASERQAGPSREAGGKPGEIKRDQWLPSLNHPFRQ